MGAMGRYLFDHRRNPQQSQQVTFVPKIAQARWNESPIPEECAAPVCLVTFVKRCAVRRCRRQQDLILAPHPAVEELFPAYALATGAREVVKETQVNSLPLQLRRDGSVSISGGQSPPLKVPGC